jgi:hypothetical protein
VAEAQAHLKSAKQALVDEKLALQQQVAGLQAAQQATQVGQLMGLLAEQRAVSAGYKQHLGQALEQVEAKAEVIKMLRESLHRVARAAVIAGAAIQLRRCQGSEQGLRREVAALASSNGR